MSLAEFATTVKTGRFRFTVAGAFLLEASMASYAAARVLLGPVSLFPNPALWLAWAGAVLICHLALTAIAASPLLWGSPAKEDGPRSVWSVLAPSLVFFSGALLLIQTKPDTATTWVWALLSPIEPFPTIATAMAILLLFLLRVLAVSWYLTRTDPRRSDIRRRAAKITIPSALLLAGVLLASVYVLPLGNAFVRVWSVADAINSGVPYPVTITELPSVLAGSPPYIWDLPIFPALLHLSFALLGHTTTAAHLPAALSVVLFPLSLYLLIRQATGSRSVSLVFTALASLFPYLRYYVLSLPDPDPFLLTILCFAAYFYLRALDAPARLPRWIVAGLFTGLLALARPEGILYSVFLTLGVLGFRPGLKQLALFLVSFGLFLGPMVLTWYTNFGFLWPQNYNRTLGLGHPADTYSALAGSGSIGRYVRGLGLDETWALGFLTLFVVAVLAGLLLMSRKDRRMLVIALSGLGNTVMVFFTNPWVTNAFHTADFFRHISYGIPFLVMTAAYAVHQIGGAGSKIPFDSVPRRNEGAKEAREEGNPLAFSLSRSLARHFVASCLRGYQRGSKLWPRFLRAAILLLLLAAMIREGDIVANPTATHRPGATQVLTDYTYLSMQAILEHPMPLPRMAYYWNGEVTFAYPTFMNWPEDVVEFYRHLDMSFDSAGRPFGYATAVAFLLAMGFALLAGSSDATEEHRPETVISRRKGRS